ncbi:MAG: hypothetical protein DSM106950_06730 [Stigonema ocellatum SAG 48.90 = DSM 106950]|nr:hypothetical protein [Stigonema ocellatum SAG 48.90 = DSM 106950]
MKKIFSSYSLKLSILLALSVTGFFSIDGYIQPIKASAQEIPSNYEQLLEKQNRAKLDTQFKLKYGQIALISSEKLRIKFLNVTNDSRCPIDVQCIQAGQVTIELEIFKNNRSIGTLSLTSNAGREDLAIGYVDGYSIKLVRVDPLPRTTKPIDISDYVATLIVSL